MLKGHPFRHVSIMGFEIKTLATFDVSCLETLSFLHNCGTIEEGFLEHPLHLRKLVLTRTKIVDGALNPAHLAHVETVELLEPTDFFMLSAATSLKELVIDQCSPASLETLDVLPPNENLKIKIDRDRSDLQSLRPALERQPSLRQKIELTFFEHKSGLYQSMSLDAFLQENPFDAESTQDAA